MFNTYILAWLRINCMDVFHYLADTLKDTPLFESANQQFNEARIGAIYNDFDREDVFGDCTSSDGEPLNLTQEEDHTSLGTVQLDDLDFAIASRPQTYKTKLADVDSESNSSTYQRKVRKLTDSNLGKLLTEKVVRVFEARMHMNWTGGDSVYDAWLIQNGHSREWFKLNGQKRSARSIISSDEESESDGNKRRLLSGASTESSESSQSSTESSLPSTNERERSQTKKQQSEVKLEPVFLGSFKVQINHH